MQRLIEPDEQQALGLPDPRLYREQTYRLLKEHRESVHAIVGEVVPISCPVGYRVFERRPYRDGSSPIYWRWIEVT